MSRRHAATRTARATRSQSCHAGPAPAAALRGGVRTRALLFVALTVLSVAGIALAWPRVGGGAVADQKIEITMSGFSVQTLTARAGQPLRVALVNPDSPYHTDGGGWHQLAIPELGVDARVGPRSETLVEIPTTTPGEYTFYCDTCCGGKENPTMRGTLRVVA